MTRERWIALAVGLITIVLTLILLAVLEAQSRVAFDCFDATERERVREISLKGIDKGLEDAVAHLFDIWQRDPETQQPKRAQVGVTNALNAHARARKYALAWTPPTCEETK